MTLLISVFAAIISTAVWYFCAERKKYLLNVPCYIFWGASVMWFVDAVFEYSELKAAYFTPAPEDMLNDAFLGFSIIALGLIVWIIILLIKDPNSVIRDALFCKKINSKIIIFSEVIFHFAVFMNIIFFAVKHNIGDKY